MLIKSQDDSAFYDLEKILTRKQQEIPPTSKRSVGGGMNCVR